jgi:hypothetical protein
LGMRLEGAQMHLHRTSKEFPEFDNIPMPNSKSITWKKSVA